MPKRIDCIINLSLPFFLLTWLTEKKKNWKTDRGKDPLPIGIHTITVDHFHECDALHKILRNRIQGRACNHNAHLHANSNESPNRNKHQLDWNPDKVAGFEWLQSRWTRHKHRLPWIALTSIHPQVQCPLHNCHEPVRSLDTTDARDSSGIRGGERDRERFRNRCAKEVERFRG